MVFERTLARLARLTLVGALGVSCGATAQTVAPPASASAIAPALTPAVASAIADRIDAEVLRQHLVGLSLVVVKDGAIVLEVHRGFEDREAETPASDRTMYRWASISKPVTAIAAVQLANAGKLDLDADVRTLVPEWPEKPWAVTSRQLLGHLGGVVHYSNGPVVADPPRADVAHPYEDVVDAVGRFAKSPLVCEPGTAYAYTTHGYILLSGVVQRAGGEPFWSQVRTRIAAPAGMTTFRPDYQWEAIPHRAIGYRNIGSGEARRSVRSTDTDVSWKLGGGGFISTVGDLARFSIAVMDRRLVPQESLETMWTEQKTRDGKSTAYGLGFGIRRDGGVRLVQHSGSQEKTATFLTLDPHARAAVAIMSNTEGAQLADLAGAVLTLARDGAEPTKTPAGR